MLCAETLQLLLNHNNDTTSCFVTVAEDRVTFSQQKFTGVASKFSNIFFTVYKTKYKYSGYM